ncbi:MAG: type II toxin-antitoxin system VapC family toxin [Caldilinea sp.]|nr:type II toxin-antitoxin system VapC family toxin [Caldilinea sp.]
MTNSSSVEWLVIDAGVGYAMSVADAATTRLRADIANKVSQGVKLGAPVFWRYELTSILTKSLHFGQLSEASAWQALELSSEIAIALVSPDDELVRQAYAWTLRLKRAAAYDSFYLALAQRLGCELWTVDHKLFKAVGAPWVRYVGSAEGKTP